MSKQLSFNTETGKLEYMGYSIAIEHNIGYEDDYSYSYIEYIASKIDGKDWDIVEDGLESLLSVIETRVKANQLEITK